MNIVVVMPTYNERDNIGKMIDLLADVFKEIPHNCKLLVVDDSSPDGTANVVREMTSKYDFVNITIRTGKTGLGSAYVHGFKYAMKELNADVIVEMDADFQHTPSDLPRLIKAIDDGADYAIGSRYVSGGGVPKEWPLYRKVISFGGTWFSKIILGIFNVNDFTGGFKASRVKGFVDQLDLDTLLTEGFAYKIELLYKMHRLGAKIKEVPITFGTREKGNSKMDNKTLKFLIDSMRVVLTLRARESQHLLKFLVVGTLGFITDFSLSNIFALTSLEKNLATSSAAFIAMMLTFTLNNLWSFSDRRISSLKEKLLSFGKYIIFSTMPIVFRYVFVGFILSVFDYTFLIYNGAILFCVGVGLVWNYIIYSKIIWRDK